jgi:hypothetical protein
VLLQVETELEQYQIRYRLDTDCQCVVGVLRKDSYKHLSVRISDCTVILQYNWQSVKCQVIKEDTVTGD